MIVYRKVNDLISLELVSPYNAEIIFNIVEHNRLYLSEYLAWVEKTISTEQVLENTQKALVSFSEKKSIDYVIREKEEIIGRISIWLIDQDTHSYEIGYWIVENKKNKGIMTSCVKVVMDIGIEYLNVEKFEIACIDKNTGSNRIAQKLGFKLEGIKRNAIKVKNTTYNMNLYGMLKSEYEEHRTIASSG